MSTPSIEFIDVWKQFPEASQPTLAGLSLVCPPKKIHTLIGHSGSGKSVTIKHVLGLMAPDRGDIKVLGESIIGMEDREMRRVRANFGMLFQGSALFDSLSVFDNVAFPLREHRRDLSEAQIADRVAELLAQVELVNAENKMPSQISGGMQKRVGLARALAMDPKIMLFDEPTTGLDPTTAKVIDDLIVSTTRSLNAAAFIISHDIHAALRISDLVSMLSHGEIILTATPDEFVKSQHETIVTFLRSAGLA
ncbi:MAG: ATP-binding cassette domain-containing protein [Bdellovibrionales bacterium]|nr:ATP-binding cassette domain-containing protein [Bdellovibrionales bacterium]